MSDSTPIPVVKRPIRLPKRPKRTTAYFKQHYGGFCGWDTLAKTFRSIDDFDTQMILLGLFKFGCRAMELPTLRKSQIDFNFSPTQIMVKSMYVEKQKTAITLVDVEGRPLYKGDRKLFRFEGKEGYRTFPIPKKEPLSVDLEDYVGSFSNDDDILFDYGYDKMYYKICNIGMVIPPGVWKSKWNEYKGPWWCHRIRSERACELIKDYHYDTFRLMKWFGWQSSQMPQVYSDIMSIDLIYDKEVDWR